MSFINMKEVVKTYKKDILVEVAFTSQYGDEYIAIDGNLYVSLGATRREPRYEKICILDDAKIFDGSSELTIDGESLEVFKTKQKAKYENEGVTT